MTRLLNFIPQFCISLLFITAALLSSFAVAQSTNHQLSLGELDDSLLKLQEQKLDFHRDQQKVIQDHEQEVAIKNEFQRRGNQGVDFILRELEKINSAEKKAMKNSEDFEGALGANEPKKWLMRYAYCYMLADMYKATDPPHRMKIIGAMVDSFLPTTQGRDDAESLSGGVFRIGKDGMRVFIQLANSDSKRNRCFADEVLGSFAKSPRVECTAPLGKQQLEISQFESWWAANSSQVRWPDVPDFFFNLPPKKP